MSIECTLLVSKYKANTNKKNNDSLFLYLTLAIAYENRKCLFELLYIYLDNGLL